MQDDECGMTDEQDRAATGSRGASPVHHLSFRIRHPLRAVLFDAVGTLIRPEPSVATAYAQAGRRHGADLPEDEIGRRFRAALVRQDEIDRVRHAGRTDQEREIERWRGIVADVFAPLLEKVSGTDSNQDGVTLDAARAAGSGVESVPDTFSHTGRIFDDLWDHFAQPSNWRLFDDAAAAWDRLASAGLTVGIASNFDDRLDRICGELAPLSACRHLFVSSRIGWRKPRAEFFASIASHLGFAPAEMMLVGDDLANDYRAAQAAGWQAVLLDRAGNAAQSGDLSDDVGPIATITSLAELAEACRPQP